MQKQADSSPVKAKPTVAKPQANLEGKQLFGNKYDIRKYIA
jgi:hypothetical protein